MNLAGQLANQLMQDDRNKQRRPCGCCTMTFLGALPLQPLSPVVQLDTHTHTDVTSRAETQRLASVAFTMAGPPLGSALDLGEFCDNQISAYIDADDRHMIYSCCTRPSHTLTLQRNEMDTR